jgi:antibiotic biosynthesis monooxygenase (ABM) superfamily enzyme
MTAPLTLMAAATVRSGADADFSAWLTDHSALLLAAPGFLGTDVRPPRADRPGTPWIITVSFDSAEHLDAWRRAPERARSVARVAPLLAGEGFTEHQPPASATPDDTQVTELIFSRVRPGMADRYREWSTRMQAAQARYPGYRGMYLQPPAHGEEGRWTTALRFDTPEQLRAWKQSPERKTLLGEADAFIESEEMLRFATAFPGWFPMDPVTGDAPPGWKAALLVLLGLFPIVMLEMRYLSPVLLALGIHASLGTFIGNALSVALTSFVTMPIFVRLFGWWLFPAGDARQVTRRGTALICLLFALEVLVLWRLLPW